MGTKTRPKSTKARRGRGLSAPGRSAELLVQKLEASLDRNIVEIKSPDHVPDIDTGELREVDVSLRVRGGSTQILVVFECRDRGRTQGLDWIEQLDSKRRSVRAHKIVAVSSNGFTATAMKKAKNLNIDLRTLKSINFETIKALLPFEHLAIASHSILNPEVTLSVEGNEQTRRCISRATSGANPLTEKLLRVDGSGELVSIETYLRALQRTPAFREAAEEALPLHPSRMLGQSASIRSMKLEVVPDDLAIIADGQHRVKRVVVRSQLRADCVPLKIHNSGTDYAPAGEESLAYHFNIAHEHPFIPGQIDLVIFPEDDRAALVTQCDDRGGRELVSIGLEPSDVA